MINNLIHKAKINVLVDTDTEARFFNRNADYTENKVENSPTKTVL